MLILIFFCDLHLGHYRLINYKIVNQICCELAQNLSILKVEKTLFNHWSEYIKEQGCISTDVACYESEVRYPTDQKLLCKSVDWCFKHLKIICKTLKLNLPRTKYLKRKKRYVSYRKCEEKRKQTSKHKKYIKMNNFYILFML
jgi:hypothetical protein